NPGAKQSANSVMKVSTNASQRKARWNAWARSTSFWRGGSGCERESRELLTIDPFAEVLVSAELAHSNVRMSDRRTRSPAGTLYVRISMGRTSDTLRDTPAYTLGQAAHYLGLPYSTVKTWVIGQHYEAEGNRKFLKPVIQPADRERNLLSFRNMVELHVLSLTLR